MARARIFRATLSCCAAGVKAGTARTGPKLPQIFTIHAVVERREVCCCNEHRAMVQLSSSFAGGPYRAAMPRVCEPPRQLPWDVRLCVVFGSNRAVLSWAVLALSGAEGVAASVRLTPKQGANAIELAARLEHATCGTLAHSLEQQYAAPSPLSFSTLGAILVAWALHRGLRACRLLSVGRLVWGRRARGDPNARDIEYEADGVSYVMSPAEPGWVVYRPRSGSRAVLVDALPGAPEIDAGGHVTRADPLRALIVLVLAAVVLVRFAVVCGIEALEVSENPPRIHHGGL